MSLLPYVLAIGINDPGVSGLEPLAHADDDAAAFVELFGARWDHTKLLANLDDPTRELFPGYAAEARPPTRRELVKAVSELVAAIERDDHATVLISIGGHAAASDDGHVELLLMDGPMSQATLFDEVIAPLSRAHRVHLIVDTCYAAALIRTRAKVEEEDGDTVRRRFLSSALSKFGNVGALLGSAPNRRAFEWEEIGSGVFSAIVRSGLRGGADVDRDDRVTYRELASFVAAASRAVPVARARPEMISLPPPVDLDASVSQMDWLGSSRVLQADLGDVGRFFVWNARGRWIFGGRFEGGFSPRLMLPNEELFLDAGGASSPLVGTSSLAIGKPDRSVADRSVLSSALESGLFAEAYGPSFHRGFVASGGMQVTLEEPSQSVAPIVLFGAAGASALAGLISGGIAIEAGVRASDTEIERDAHDAAVRYRAAGITSIATLSVGVVLAVVGALVD